MHGTMKPKWLLIPYNSQTLSIRRYILWIIYIVTNQQDEAVRSQFYFTAGSLYIFRVLSTPIIRSTLNCIYSLRYRFYYRCSYLLLTWPLATSEEGSCNDNITCTGGCRYSLMYSWWWVWRSPEICRVTLQWNKIDCEQLHLVGLLQYRINNNNNNIYLTAIVL